MIICHEETTHRSDNADNDGAWKDILENYFSQAMELCFPTLFYLIDWKKEWIFLDTEFRALTKNSITNTKHVDKLIRVHLIDGSELWILIIFEIQHQKDINFPERLFLYTTRGYDKYRKIIIPCVVLADQHKKWYPTHFELRYAEMRLRLDFMSCKLLHFEQIRDDLEKSMNPFATIILNQLDAIKVKRKNKDAQYNVKMKLVRNLYKKGFSKEDVLNIHRFLDFVIALPKEFQLKFEDEIYQMEEMKRMTYYANFEVRAMKKNTIEIARNLIIENANLSLISKVTKLDMDTLEQMKNEINESKDE
jgi:hypothetical protein